MKQIFIIDDDIHIGNMLQELLEREGYGVLRAYSGTEALLVLDSKKPDLILLDLMLPGLSGEEVLQRIGGIPVIVVSAKVDVGNKVDLLMGGASDYITKPFDTRELLARIAVQLRKNESQPCAGEELLTCGELSINTASHEAWVKQQPVRLTRTEYAILKLLMRNCGQVISKSVILDRIMEDTPDCTESSLKQHVSNLRKKLRDAGDREYVESVWGIGFRISESEKA